MLFFGRFTVNKGKYGVYKLNEGELKKMIADLPSIYRRSYISDEKLEESISRLTLEREEIIRDYIPDEPVIKSGEFGEIFSTYFLIEKYEYDNQIVLYHPNKLYWKEDRNKALKLTDVVLFSYKEGEEYNEDDLLISGEIKTKATQNNSFDPIQDAMDGIINDKISRLSKTLNWLKERHTKDMNQSGIDYINRYRFPLEKPFKKHFKGVILIDADLADRELDRSRTPKIKIHARKAKKLTEDIMSLGAEIIGKNVIDFKGVDVEKIKGATLQNQNEILELFNYASLIFDEPCEILIISINDLKDTYEELYNRIPQ